MKINEGEKCPDCGSDLHVGTEKEGHEENRVAYCKKCGFRKEILVT